MPFLTYAKLAVAVALLSLAGVQTIRLRTALANVTVERSAADAARRNVLFLSDDLKAAQLIADREHAAGVAAAVSLTVSEAARTATATALQLAMKGTSDADLTHCLNLPLPPGVLQQLPQ